MGPPTRCRWTSSCLAPLRWHSLVEERGDSRRAARSRDRPGLAASSGHQVVRSERPAARARRPGPPRRDKTDLVVLGERERHQRRDHEPLARKLDYKDRRRGRLSIKWLKVIRSRAPTPTSRDHHGEKRYSALFAPTATSAASSTARRDPDPVTTSSPSSRSTPVLQPLSAYFIWFDLREGNEALTFSTDGYVGYRGERLGTSVQSTLTSRHETARPPRRTTRSVDRRHVLRPLDGDHRRSGQENSELDLKLRLTFLEARSTRGRDQPHGARGERRARRAPEQYTTGTPLVPRRILAGSWSLFATTDRSSTPSGPGRVPVLTDFGRVLLQGTLRVTYEVFLDFNVG